MAVRCRVEMVKEISDCEIFENTPTTMTGPVAVCQMIFD